MFNHGPRSITGLYKDTIDWAFPSGSRRTRREYPYSYDAYFVWRDFDKHDQPKSIGGEYSDRLMQHDHKKYEKARDDSSGGWIEDISKEQAKKFIESYYDGKYECVGFAACCNVSNGYGIGIFYIQLKEY